MQPVAVISCRTPGIVYLNGRFAGECAQDAPLIVPVSPRGPLYIEHRPLARGFASQAHRVAFAGGALIAESAQEGIFAVKWPGNVAELELAAAPYARAESAFASMDGLPVAILRGEATILRIAGRELPLPEDAALPDARAQLGEDPCFLGSVGALRYLACFSADEFMPMGAVVADNIEIEDGRVRALISLRDIVGHARIEVWEPRDGRLELADAEYAWANGTPLWPRTAADTARAALEAAILGLDAEAEGYLSPPLRDRNLLATCTAGFDSCVPLKYALPHSRPAVGLLRRETARCALVSPVFYTATPMGSTQGPWALEALEGEEAGEQENARGSVSGLRQRDSAPLETQNGD